MDRPSECACLSYDGAVERHGRVTFLRTWGHDREGGEVVSLCVAPMHHPGEKVSLVELFELEHVDDALARFEELRPQCSDPRPTP